MIYNVGMAKIVFQAEDKIKTILNGTENAKT